MHGALTLLFTVFPIDSENVKKLRQICRVSRPVGGEQHAGT